MLLDYVKAAMSRAKYAPIEDGTYFGEIPGFRGVWANAQTRSECRRELQEVLEEWIVVNLRLGNNPPKLPGVGAFPRVRLHKAADSQSSSRFPLSPRNLKLLASAPFCVSPFPPVWLSCACAA